MSTYVSSLCTRTLQNPWMVGQPPSEDRLSTRRPHIVHSTSSIDGDTINNEQKFVFFSLNLVSRLLESARENVNEVLSYYVLYVSYSRWSSMNITLTHFTLIEYDDYDR